MKYTNEQLDKWKQNINAQVVIGTRVKLSKDGQEALGLCPFHQEQTPSFKVYKKDGVWLFHCFGCSRTGNIFQFFQWADKISFESAVEKVLQLSGWEEGREIVDSVFAPAINSTKLETFSLTRMKYAEENLANSPEAQKWLAGRGLSLEVAQSLHLGYLQNLASVSPNHPWVANGWMVIPTVQGETVTSVQYRSLMGKKTEDGKKSGILRQPHMATALYNIGAISPADDCYITEGAPDCLAMTQAGYNSVALPSAEYSPSPEERTRLIGSNRIFLAGDMDSAGQGAMQKLWTEFRDRTYMLSWPTGCKDANETLLKECHGDVDKFQVLVEKLKEEALERPMQFMYDLKQSLQRMDKTNPLDNTRRMRFPWPTIDKWTAVVPGDVMTLFATESKTGKSTWLMNLLMHNATKYGKVIVNYSAELLPPAYARRVVSYLTHTDRNQLVQGDYDAAVRKMENVKFYNGYQPKANYKTVVDLLVAAKKRLGADIIVIDHLHFLTRGTKDENQAVGEAMRLLKDFAFDYDVIVIVVGQPRKMANNQRAREATAQDAKSSEAFGSDASQVFILHRNRTSMVAEGDPIFSPVTKVKLDYSRESETKFTNLFFEGACCSFYEMDKNTTVREEQ